MLNTVWELDLNLYGIKGHSQKTNLLGTAEAVAAPRGHLSWARTCQGLPAVVGHLWCSLLRGSELWGTVPE